MKRRTVTVTLVALITLSVVGLGVALWVILASPGENTTASAAEQQRTTTRERNAETHKLTFVQEPQDADIRTLGKAKLRAEVVGPNHSYQWYRQAPEGGEFIPIAGETGRTITIPGADRHNGASYRVTATSRLWQETSAAVTISVIYPTNTPVNDFAEAFGQQAETVDAAAVTTGGLDVSRWNRVGTASDTATEGWQFVIAKNGGSDWPTLQYNDSKYEQHVAAARNAGLAVGHYWFNGQGEPVDDADFFVDALFDYRAGDPLVLDIEPYTIRASGEEHSEWTPEQALTFLNRVSERIPDANLYVYMSADTTWDHNWAQVSERARLWVASWGPDMGRIPLNEPSILHWDTWTIWQYSSFGRPSGYNNTRIDVNIARDDAW